MNDYNSQWQDNNEQKANLGNLENTLDILIFGQPDMKSHRINEAIKRRLNKRGVNQYK